MSRPGPEVTVVGAGPVGMTLAALLGAAGRRVLVLERRPAPSGQPRAVHLDHQAARILDAAGVMAGLEPATEAMDAYEWRSAAGEVLLRIEPDGPLGRSGWPESLMFAQPDLEAALSRRLDLLPSVELRRESHVSELSALGQGWIVGCDGAASTVRRNLGIGWDDRGFAHDWLVVDVVEHPARPWHPCNVQVCDPSRPMTAVSGGPRRRRFEFMRLPGEDPEALGSEATAWRLLETWGLGPDRATLVRHALYRFEARAAERWREGRVLLAGDSAHQLPPFAGQGLCAGLRDAANLAWKLEAVLAGVAGPDLLDTYETERRAQTEVEIGFSIDLGRIICTADPDEAARRDIDMAQAYRASGPVPPPPLPPLGPGLLREDDPAAGTLAVHGVVDVGGRRGRPDDVVGRGWTLHGRDGDPVLGPDPDLLRWWTDLGGRSVDCSGWPDPYPAWFAELGAAAVLVRPDFAVYGAADDAGVLLAELHRQLGSTGR